MSGTSGIIGYRARDERFHGPGWFPGELVSFGGDRRGPRWQDACEPAGVTRTLVSPGFALIHLLNVDWVDRRAALEIRVLEPEPTPELGLLLDRLADLALRSLGLVRLEGWVTPVHYDVSDHLTRARFRREAVVPQAVRVDGRAVGRELWSRVA